MAADHELGHLDLAERLHLFEQAERAFGHRLVLEDLDGLGVQPFEEIFPEHDFLNVEIEGLCDLRLGHAAVQRFHDHLVLLDDGEAVDLVVVGERIVIEGEQAGRGGVAEFAERLQPQVAVEEQEGALGAFVGKHDERFDEADGLDRGEHRPVFAEVLIGGLDLPDGQNRIEGEIDAAAFKPEADDGRGAHGFWRTRSTINLGSVPRSSARRRVVKFSSASRARNAAVRESRRVSQARFAGAGFSHHEFLALGFLLVGEDQAVGGGAAAAAQPGFAGVVLAETFALLQQTAERGKRRLLHGLAFVGFDEQSLRALVVHPGNFDGDGDRQAAEEHGVEDAFLALGEEFQDAFEITFGEARLAGDGFDGIALAVHPLDELDLVEGADAAARDVFHEAGDEAVGLRQAADEGGNFGLAECDESFEPALPADEIVGGLAVGIGLCFGDGNGALETLIADAADDLLELAALAHAGVGDADCPHRDHQGLVIVRRGHATSSMEMRSASA